MEHICILPLDLYSVIVGYLFELRPSHYTVRLVCKKFNQLAMELEKTYPYTSHRLYRYFDNCVINAKELRYLLAKEHFDQRWLERPKEFMFGLNYVAQGTKFRSTLPVMLKVVQRGWKDNWERAFNKNLHLILNNIPTTAALLIFRTLDYAFSGDALDRAIGKISQSSLDETTDELQADCGRVLRLLVSNSPHPFILSNGQSITLEYIEDSLRM